MTFNIINKNPRKPRVEGPRARERYVENLNQEWIDNHATKQPEPEEPWDDRVPSDVQERARRLEAETREKLADELAAERRKAFYSKQGIDITAVEASRPDTLRKLAAADRAMIGYVRDHILEEAAALGIEL